MMEKPGRSPIHQFDRDFPSPCRIMEGDDGADHDRDQARRIPGSDQIIGATSMDVDRMVKGKQILCSSSPPLLITSLDQGPESSNDAHRRFVEKVKQALSANKVSSEMHDDLDSEDSGLEDSADEKTLWDFQKGIQKGSQARKGVQLLSSVQKKKIQKKKRAKG